jgi:enterochelin esterase-like enzyme
MMKKSIEIERNTTHPQWEGQWLVTFSFDTASDYETVEEHLPKGAVPEPEKTPDPDRKIEKVYLKGSFQFYRENEIGSYQAFEENPLIRTYDAFEYQKGMFGAGINVVNGQELQYEMHSVSESLYQITLPLPSGIYGYGFSILYSDGTVEKNIYDPENMPPKNGDYTFGESVFALGEIESEPEPLCYALARKAVDYGTQTYVTYQAVDGTEQPLGIWVPQGYTSEKKYRTIYVSHGGGGNEVEWMVSGRLPFIMQNLICSGKTEEAIIVTMNNTYFNWEESQTLSNMIECILPYVETHYSVLPGAQNRALCGLSMGSMMTNSMMKRYPEKFGYYGGFSGGATDHDLTHYKPESLKKCVIYETCGNVDIAYNNKRGISTLDYLKTLDRMEISYTFELLNGGHDWGVWRESFVRFAMLFLGK